MGRGRDRSRSGFSAVEVNLQESSPEGKSQENGCFQNFSCKSEKKIWKTMNPIEAESGEESPSLLPDEKAFKFG